MTHTDTRAELQRFRDTIGTEKTSRRSTRALGIAAGAVVATAAAVALVTIGAGGSDAPAQVAGTVQAPAPLPEEAEQATITTAGSSGTGVYPAAGALWHVPTRDLIERIDPATDAVTELRLGVTAYPPFVEAGGLVWFAGVKGAEQRFFALDPATNTIAVTSGPVASARTIGSGPAGLWATTGLRQLTELDPRTGEVLRTVSTSQGVYDVHVGDGVVYAGAYSSGTGVTVVDTATGQSRVVLPEVAPGPLALTADGDLWLNDAARGGLFRYDGGTFAQEAEIPLSLDTSRGAKRDFGWTESNERMRLTDGWGDGNAIYPVLVGDSLYATYNPGGSARLLHADAATGTIENVYEIDDVNAVGPVTLLDGSLWTAWQTDGDVIRRIALVE